MNLSWQTDFENIIDIHGKLINFPFIKISLNRVVWMKKHEHTCHFLFSSYHESIHAWVKKPSNAEMVL